MRVIIAGGGTGGHVIPALAVAAELRRRSPDNDVLMVGTSRGLEARLAPRHGVPLETIDVGALKRVGAVQTAITLAGLPYACFRAARLLERFLPDVVYGVGGYASGPMLLMAAMRELPVVVHEPNAMPGFANRVIAPFVTRALIAFPEAARFFPATRVEVVGVPVRAEFFRVPVRNHEPPYTVLIFGGSQGARRINQTVMDALPLLSALPLRFIHQTGERDYDAIRAAYAQNGLQERCEVLRFIDDMAGAFARADLLICRSGASTIAEITAAGKVALLIPFAFSADEHQLKNAESLVRAGAARLLRESELNPESLVAEVQDMLPWLSDLERNARGLGKPGAVERIVDVLEETGVRNQE